MCLVLLAHNAHPHYRLIVAANRDEFYERPTAPAAFWSDNPSILAGRDLQHGGTWMGVTKAGRFAALTNYRDPLAIRAESRSRGKLVSAFLEGEATPADFLKEVEKEARQYNDFNLLVGDLRADPCEIHYFGSRDSQSPRDLGTGIHALSNHLLNTPWPKVRKLKEGFNLLEEGGKVRGPKLAHRLFDVLSDRAQALEAELPETGVSFELERKLSSLFIVSPTYGTRASTVLFVGPGENVEVYERSFGPGGVLSGEAQYQFTIGGGTTKSGGLSKP